MTFEVYKNGTLINKFQMPILVGWNFQTLMESAGETYHEQYPGSLDGYEWEVYNNNVLADMSDEVLPNAKIHFVMMKQDPHKNETVQSINQSMKHQIN